MIVDNPEIPNYYHVVYMGKKENIKGKPIEQYFEDFRHVRIVPYDIIRDRTFSKNCPNELFSNTVQKFTTRVANEEVDVDNFTNSPDFQTIEYYYRWLIKMNWLINDIRTKGCCEPIWGTIVPSFNKLGGVDYTYHVHPGTFRVSAFEIMERNEQCVVFDAFEVFHDYPKASLAQILELYNDPVGTDVEINILQQDTSYMTPQIMNMHPKGLNCSMTPSLKKWEKRVRHMFNVPLKIFIGYDSRHNDATNVCHNSILETLDKRERDKVEIIHLDTSKIPGWEREYKNQSTEFSYSRFLVPYLSDYKGISIFVDDDFIFRKNPLVLALFLTHNHSVACVKHDFEKKFDTKFNGEKDVWYPKKLWSSLMVFNNSHPDCKKLTLDSVQRESGKFLHQFEWTNDSKIADLPAKWNWCEGYHDVMDAHKSLGLHWTRGGPWIDDMNTTHIAMLELYDWYRLRRLVGVGERFTYQEKQVSILDMKHYYDIENPVKVEADGTRICRSINKDVR